ncbi:MAG TPA: RNA 2',3'-cyclic phosphodiesterase [Thermoleophilia bacterium]|nr:RNA 2',3'-cyclic phosphodiesterase [Thermoleophilia bacterium]
MSVAGSPATLRLFVAGDIPDAAQREIAAWQQRALVRQPGLRVNRALHITLVFLGSVDAARVDDIADALSGIRFHAASVAVGGPVFLPARGAKRALVLPLREADGTLARLQADVSRALVVRGLCEPPGRPWLPHVTVARVRRPGHPFPLQNVNIGGFGVVRMVLYSSLLERAGAVHTPLKVFSAS